MPSAADKVKKKAAADKSGDEYDSGGEVERTAADDSFIDNEDDDDNLLKEYAQDKQNFDDDERPEGHDKQKKRKVRASVCGRRNVNELAWIVNKPAAACRRTSASSPTCRRWFVCKPPLACWQTSGRLVGELAELAPGNDY